eukprot:6214142-Pleurochrysis_carterae.AAC.1
MSGNARDALQKGEWVEELKIVAALMIDMWLDSNGYDTFLGYDAFIAKINRLLCAPLSEQSRAHINNTIVTVQDGPVSVEEVAKTAQFWSSQVRSLYVDCERFSLVGPSSIEAVECQRALRRVAEVIKDSCDAVVAASLARRKMNLQLVQSEIPCSYETTTALSKDITKQNTNFQNAVLYTLSLLRKHGLQKHKDVLYEQMKTTNGRLMHAWQRKQTIKEFIATHVTKEADYVQWCNMTNPRDNLKAVAEHICDSEHPECRSLVFKRTLFAFGDDIDEHGGLYCIEQDVFFPYAEQESWSDYAERVDRERQQFGEFCTRVPTQDDVAVSYFPQGFHAWGGPCDEYSCDPLGALKTPHVEKVLDDQRLTPDTKKWVYALLGRLLYSVGEKDNWQTLLFIKGVAGSGKSTLAKLMRHVYPSSMVATLSSNVEAKFGLSALYDKFLVICAEVKKDFGLNQGDLQSAVSGEEVSVAIKNQTAITVTWSVPFLFAGNELAAWKDAAGSMKRRLVVVEFNEPVVPDPSLYDCMLLNFGAFLRKINLTYLMCTNDYGNDDIWKPGVLSEQMHEFARKMKENVDIFSGYLSSGVFVIDAHNPATCYMPLGDLKDMYFAWRQQHNFEREPWKPDVYNMALREKGLYVNDMRETKTYMGKTIQAQFVYGIRPHVDICAEN